jgi:fibro-slime domain-containing protein
MGGNNPRRQCALLHLGAIAALIFAGCSSASIINSGQGGGAGQGTAGGGGKGGNGTSSGAGGFVLTLPDASADHPGGGNCGDGVIERNEDCDDGNTISGDGCSRICQVESNYQCKEQGKPCENLAQCGNGILTSDEICDDGNTVSGDGCSSDCGKVEPGYQCRVPGKPCTPKCGDGIKSGVETCDDGNTVAGDGCSVTCHIETGFKCDDSTPTNCSKTTCGDGKKEGGEGCDDGNTVPFDGCSEDCQIEPDCTGTSCTSKCGDGIVLDEDCDDGNAASGDGCSKDCKKEDGWTCSQPDIGDKMEVPVIYRDFHFSGKAGTSGTDQNDFENGVTGQRLASTGMVKTDLDSEGKPVYANPANPGGAVHVQSADSFATWFHTQPDSAKINHATASKLALWKNADGAYVNRYGANGDQWDITEIVYWCGQSGQEKTDPTSGKAIPCTFAQGTTDCDAADAKGYEQLKCYLDGTTYKAIYSTGKVDGNPLFFPIDNDAFSKAEMTGAQVPSEPKNMYDASGTWPWDLDAAGNKILHNFSFTSEVRYWFKYDSSKPPTLDFVGDDDVWVFINRKLALDIGGIHTPVEDSVTLDSTSAGKLGLTSGKVYEIAVFQAERQTTCSSYKLTLSGFNAAPTSCVPTCGDGFTVADEECDCGSDDSKVPKGTSCPGPNSDDAYGGCTTKCTWGGYCGDGIINGTEECDDGKDNGTKNGEGGCTLGCTKQHYCGDGHVDTDRGEVCDLGDRNGQTLDSQLNPATGQDTQIYCNADCSIPKGIVY